MKEEKKSYEDINQSQHVSDRQSQKVKQETILTQFIPSKNK